MAGRYICPVCDRRLKTKHFCTYCKSFVKEPVYYTGPVANESYDSAGRPGCMADQHYGLGHVHSPLERQREYGHNRAGTKRPVPNRQTVSGRGTQTSSGRSGSRGYGTRPGPARSVYSGQEDRRRQTEKQKQTARKFMLSFLAIVFALFFFQLVYTLIRWQSSGLLEVVPLHVVLLPFLGQLLGTFLQICIFGLVIWAVLRNFRRK